MLAHTLKTCHILYPMHAKVLSLAKECSLDNI